MKPKSTPFLCLLPVLALAACGGQVQGRRGRRHKGGDGTGGGDGTSNGAPSSSPTGSPPSRPSPPPPSSAPTSNLPKPSPGECALSGEGFPDALLRTSAPYRELAAYAVVDVQEECSGAGGTHIWLKNLNPSLCGGAPMAHLGGHACFPAVKRGDTVIAATYLEKVSADRPEWCLENTMPADGRVRAFRVLKPGENFTNILRDYGCN